MSRFRKLYLASAAVGALTAMPAWAQDAGAASSGKIEDIVVTARKRAESLLSVPVAVTALSAATIERSGANDLSRIAQLAPQVSASRGDTGGGATFTIRGIGTSFVDAGTDQSVSVNIDGVQASRGVTINVGFFDLQQVEVLKGPQALFFGKNSPAGVISLRSVDPSDKLEGYVRAGYEIEARERYAEGAVGGPLTDTLKARIAVRYSKMRGWLANTAVPVAAGANPFQPVFGNPGPPGKGNGGEDLIGRITLKYEPQNDFDATLKVSGGTHEDNSSTAQTICDAPVTYPIVINPLGITAVDTSGDCRLDDRTTYGSIDPELAQGALMFRNGEPYTKVWSILSSLTMNYRMGDLTLTSVTGFLKAKNRQLFNFSFDSFATLMSAAGENYSQFSQELRLLSDYEGPLNFTLGGYYEDVKRSNLGSSFLIDADLLGAGGADPITGQYNTYENIARNRNRAISGFGQLRWSVLDNVELAGGVRYTRERRRLSAENTYAHPIVGGSFGLVPVGTSVTPPTFTDSDWSPEVTLSWKPRNGMLLYGALKTGYKSGGFSSPGLLNTFIASRLGFKSEKAKGGEIGFKGEFADRTLLIQATAYSYLYKNLQESEFDQTTFSFFVANAASARVKGVELAAEWRATSELTLKASGSYNSAKFLNFTTAPCYTYQTRLPELQPGEVFEPGTCRQFGSGTFQNLSGRRLPRAPLWTFSAGASYDVPLTQGLNLGLNADVNYTGGYQAIDDQPPIGYQKGYALLNAGARIYSDGGWDIALIGRNLTNKFYKALGTTHPFAPSYEYLAYTPRARELRIQVGYRF